MEIQPENIDLETVTPAEIVEGIPQTIKIEGRVPFTTALEIANAVEKIMKKNHATQTIEKDTIPGGGDAAEAGAQG